MPTVLTRMARSQVARFIVVGVVNTTVAFIVFRSVLALLPPRVGAAAAAQAAAYAVAMVCSFLLNRRWTFGSDAAAGPAFARFVAAQLTMLALSSGAVEIGVSAIGLPPTVSWVLATGGVAVVNYLTLRRWVFRAPPVGSVAVQ